MVNEKLLKIRDEIIKLREEKDNIRKQIEKGVAELQDICNHESIIETPHTSTDYSTNPPRRICLICVIEENGWGCGYEILKEEPIRIVSRDKFFEYRNFKPFELRPVPTEE